MDVVVLGTFSKKGVEQSTPLDSKSFSRLLAPLSSSPTLVKKVRASTTNKSNTKEQEREWTVQLYRFTEGNNKWQKGVATKEGIRKDVLVGKLSHGLDHGIMIGFARRSSRINHSLFDLFDETVYTYPPKIENVMHDTLSKILVLVFF